MRMTAILLVGVTTFTGSGLAEGTLTSGAVFQGRIVGGPDPIITQTPVHDGRLDKAVIAGPLTIGITNLYGHERPEQFGNDLFVSYMVLAGYPPALYAWYTTGNHSDCLPTGWAGTIKIGKPPLYPDGSPANPDCSLIEANWVNELPDFDVSYVNGYSVPITCSCASVTMTGCNIELYDLGTPCPNYTFGDTCVNTLVSDFRPRGSPATPFFQPCQGSAWTYVNDSDANAECTTNLIECCVGKVCQTPAKQGTHPNPRS